MPRLSTKLTTVETLTEAQVTTIARAVNAYGGTRFDFRDDWTYGNTVSFANSGSQPVVMGNYTVEWTNNATISPITGTGRLGVVGLVTGALTEAINRVRTSAMGAFDSTKYSQIDYEAVVAFEALSTAGDEYWAEIGLVGNRWLETDNLGDVPGFGHFFRYKRTVGGVKWIAVNRNLDVETAVILDGTTQGGITTVDGGSIDAVSFQSYGFFRLKVIATADGAGAGASAAYYVNDVLCATITTNMVTHSLCGSVAIRKTAGTTPRYLALDYTCLGYTMRTAQVREP